MAALTLSVLTTKTTHVLRLHYTTLHCNTLHYTTLHYTALHYIALYYTTPRLHYTTVALHYTMAIHVYAFLQLLHNFSNFINAIRQHRRGVYPTQLCTKWDTRYTGQGELDFNTKLVKHFGLQPVMSLPNVLHPLSLPLLLSWCTVVVSRPSCQLLLHILMVLIIQIPTVILAVQGHANTGQHVWEFYLVIEANAVVQSQMICSLPMMCDYLFAI